MGKYGGTKGGGVTSKVAVRSPTTRVNEGGAWLINAFLLGGDVRVSVGSRDAEIISRIGRHACWRLKVSGDPDSCYPTPDAFRIDTEEIAAYITENVEHLQQADIKCIMLSQVKILERCAESNDYMKAQRVGALIQIVMCAALDVELE
jgi:hypothetical protein